MALNSSHWAMLSASLSGVPLAINFATRPSMNLLRTIVLFSFFSVSDVLAANVPLMAAGLDLVVSGMAVSSPMYSNFMLATHPL